MSVRARRLDLLTDLVEAGFEDIVFDVLQRHLDDLRALHRLLLAAHVRA